MKFKINETDIHQELEFLKHETYWVQVFKPEVADAKQKGVLCSEFANITRVLELCRKWNGRGLFCVAVNERPPGKTKASDVPTASVLLVDVDVRKKRKKKYVSTPADHEYALDVGRHIKKWMNAHGFSVGLVVDSGNGCQLLTKVSIDIQEETARTEFLSRVTMFEKKIQQEFNDDVVEVDCITKDINRRLKLAGTINMKNTKQAENRIAKIIYAAPTPKTKHNNEAFFKIKYEDFEDIEDSPETKIPKLRKMDEMATFDDVLSKDPKLRKLIEQDYSDFGNDRSDAEASIVSKLIFYGLSKETIFSVMNEHTLKWKNKPTSYKELTYKKTLDFAKKRAKEQYDRFFPASNKKTSAAMKLDAVTLKELLAEGIPIIKWRVFPLVPASGITMVVGDPESCKTWFSMLLSLCCSAGADFLNTYATEKCSVLYVDKENGKVALHNRLARLKYGHGFEYDFGDFFTATDIEFKLDGPEVMQMLSSFIRKHNVKLVVFDSIVRFLDGDENSANDVSRLFQSLKTITATHEDLSFVYIHHRPKSGIAARGSGDFLAAPDVSIQLTSKNDKSVAVSLLKNRHMDKKKLEPFLIHLIDGKKIPDSDELDIQMQYVPVKSDQVLEKCAEAMRAHINSKYEECEDFNSGDLQKIMEIEHGFNRSAYHRARALLVSQKIITPVKNPKNEALKRGVYKVVKK
jgi:hypothetical protein